MQQRQELAAIVAVMAIMAAPFGVAAAKANGIAPMPVMFFVLGVVATLCVGGIVYGIWEARKVVHNEFPLRD